MGLITSPSEGSAATSPRPLGLSRWYAHPYNRPGYYRLALAAAPRLPRRLRRWVATGAVRVLRYVLVHDSGRAVNPMIVDAQMEGGTVQGIGSALMEEVLFDGEGQLLTTTLMDYLIPTAADVPSVDQDHLNALSPRNPLGIKGIGEGGAIGPPAAIANAVEDALSPFGVVVTEIPLTPERVLALIRKARA